MTSHRSPGKCTSPLGQRSVRRQSVAHPAFFFFEQKVIDKLASCPRKKKKIIAHPALAKRNRHPGNKPSTVVGKDRRSFKVPIPRLISAWDVTANGPRQFLRLPHWPCRANAKTQQ